MMQPVAKRAAVGAGQVLQDLPPVFTYRTVAVYLQNPHNYHCVAELLIVGIGPVW